MLGLLYSNQKGNANGSTFFDILRGVKQGDVISSMLFNAGLEAAFRSWKRRLGYHGFLLDENMQRLTNTRYANDVMLYAKSLEEIIVMTEMLIEELFQSWFIFEWDQNQNIDNRFTRLQPS